MPRTILTTVGTSLMTNARRDFNLPTDPGESELAAYLHSQDPSRASAETNSLHRILESGDRIVFVHSQTSQGHMCARVLAQHYRNQGYETDTVEVADLTYEESRFKMRGLRSLVAGLIERLRREQAQGRQVLINATGGFKAEIAYATLIGLLFRVPVYYIHEAFRDIIEMPPVPIDWDLSLLAEYEDFFEWLQADLRTTPEVDDRLRGLPSEIRLLLTEEAGYTFLSPAGEAFYEAYRLRYEQARTMPLLFSRKARIVWKGLDPSARTVLGRILGRLRMREVQARAERVRNSDCLVYPRGASDFRVFFFIDDAGQVRICEITRHSDGSYERRIQEGVFKRSYRDFQPAGID